LTISNNQHSIEGEGWYNEGSLVELKTEPIIEILPKKIRKLFVSWDVGQAQWSNENNIVILKPITLSVNWRTQFYLSVSSDPSEISTLGSGWYDEGSSAIISTQKELILEPGKHKYEFNTWESKGDFYPFLQNPQNSWTYLEINNYYEIEAKWNEVWRITSITTLSNSIENIENEWCQTNDTILLERMPDSSHDRVFLGWWIDDNKLENIPTLLKIEKSQTIEARYTKLFSVTINVFPAKSPLLIDGIIILPENLPKTYSWIEGSEHKFGLPSSLTNGPAGTRYIFTGWNDLYTSYIRSESINTDSQYTVFLKTQHYLTLNSEHSHPQGEGWYDEDTLVQFDIEPLVYIENNNSRYKFSGWDKGITPWSTKNSIYLTNPVVITSQWKTQHYLQLLTSVKGPIVSGEGWYDEGSSARISSFPIYEPQKNSQKFTFKEWVNVGKKSPIENVMNDESIIYVDDHYKIMATWDEWYYLAIESIYREPEGEGYYLKDERAYISLETPFTVNQNQERFIFDKWTNNPELESKSYIIMDKPITLLAEWKRQFYLGIVSAYGNVHGSGWYNEGSIATVYADKIMSAGLGRQTEFMHWSGDILSEELETQVFMDSSHTLYANWYTNSTPLELILFSLVGTGSAIMLFVGKNVFREKKERVSIRLKKIYRK
jgi:hypothetical protein